MKLSEEVKAIIRDVHDFPKPGIVFKDITPLLADGALFERVTDWMVERYRGAHPTHVLCIESRGFIFGASVAHRLGAGLIPARKAGKLPWKTASQSYELEYGTDTIEIHLDACDGGKRVLMVDDLLATGGTMEAALKLVRRIGGSPVACAFVIELGFLPGREKLGDIPVHSLMRVD